MTQTKDTGGPAFPANHFDLADNEHGMTLRDWFAGMALQGMLASHDVCDSETEVINFNVISELSYGYADAMLEEREK